MRNVKKLYLAKDGIPFCSRKNCSLHNKGYYFSKAELREEFKLFGQWEEIMRDHFFTVSEGSWS